MADANTLQPEGSCASSHETKCARGGSIQSTVETRGLKVHLVKLCKFVHCKPPDVVHRQALLLLSHKAQGDHHVLCVGCTEPVLNEFPFPVLQAEAEIVSPMLKRQAHPRAQHVSFT